MAFSFECYAITHIGNRRKNNEDNLYIGELLTLEEQKSMTLTGNRTIHKNLIRKGDTDLIFAVSDGMGGYKDGEVASYIVTDALNIFSRGRLQKPNSNGDMQEPNSSGCMQKPNSNGDMQEPNSSGGMQRSDRKLLKKSARGNQQNPMRIFTQILGREREQKPSHRYSQKPSSTLQDKNNYLYAFQNMINQTNQKILEYADAYIEADNMGATLSGLIFFADEAVPFNIGDSSTFLYESNILQKLTIDDNEASIFENAESTELKELAYSSEFKNNGKLLTKYFGLPISCGILTAVFSPPIILRMGQIFIIASDGLTDYLTNDDICEIVKANNDINAAAKELVSSALCGETGGRDNITVVMIKVNKA